MHFVRLLKLKTLFTEFHHGFSLNVAMSTNKRNSDEILSRTKAKIKCTRDCIPSSILSSQQPIQPIQQLLTMNTVEVMETPDKAESDKKSYRVIRLSNGLKTLLISDPAIPAIADNSNIIQAGPINGQNRTTRRASSHCAESSVEGSSSSEEDENDEDNSDDGDDESNDREKLSACSLCVDVGSFSDPRDVQGLAHFLGKFAHEIENKIL